MHGSAVRSSEAASSPTSPRVTVTSARSDEDANIGRGGGAMGVNGSAALPPPEHAAIAHTARALERRTRQHYTGPKHVWIEPWSIRTMCLRACFCGLLRSVFRRRLRYR